MKFGDFKWEIRTSTTLPVGLLLLKQDGAPPCSACQLMFNLYNYSYIYHKPYRQASEISRIRELGPLGGSTKRRTAHVSQRNGLIGPMSWFPARWRRKNQFHCITTMCSALSGFRWVIFDDWPLADVTMQVPV